MITFRKIELSDWERFAPYLMKDGMRSCTQSFQTIYLWSNVYQNTFAIEGGWLLIKSGSSRSYAFPFGEGDLREAVDLLLEDAHQEGRKLRFFGLTAEQKEKLEALYPGKFRYTPDRDNAEYLYDAERMTTYAGKKLHAKRNFVNRFLENHPDWEFLPFTEENIPAVRAMHREWAAINEGSEEGLHQEGCVVSRCLKEYEALGMTGGVLMAGGKVLGFSVASLISPTVADINIEKAFADEPGAYPMVCREMARLLKERYPALTTLNREEDMGDEGLRRSKESYYPTELLEKYITEEL